MRAERVAAQLHDLWRAPRLKADGTFEPRVKDDGAGGQVDIANTPYDQLPSRWQAENLASAQHALRALELTSSMEEAADLVHQAWLMRNGEWAPQEQKLPYRLLSEEEKEKDRVVVRVAAREMGVELT